ncbi:Transcription factor ste11 [Elsinoe australis]|uniref:Transcription factor ste11 n=1 Tax=Elsinoe australis TaxID=40998 RepID=A0A2P7ZAV5_9PEZI|nr:Transcription factor ste11 [Elsinoe australis]
MSNNAADYNLRYVAEHNAHFGDYQQDGSWNPDDFNFDLDHSGTGQSYTYSDPQQIQSSSAAATQQDVVDAVRTRSGRVTRRTQSPAASSGVSNSRVSKSPRPKKTKARSDKVKNVHLPGPLSEITKDSSIPVRNIEAWVNRPVSERNEETQKRKGYIARPMNSFMLYRSAYAERTKEWCKENNHQVVSSVAGESWPMESDELRNQYNAWAKIERDNHAAAFPHYKFSPSKAGIKRKDEDDGPDPDQGDSDAEYIPSRRIQRQSTSPYQSSVRSESPAISDTYSSGVDYSPYDYPWLAQQGPRPLPAPHGLHHTDPYSMAPPINTSFHGLNRSFAFPAAQCTGYGIPNGPQWEQQQFELPRDHYVPMAGNAGPYYSQSGNLNFQYPSLQSPRTGFAPGQGWSEFGIDPSLTTTDLDAAYERDLDRDRNAH